MRAITKIAAGTVPRHSLTLSEIKAFRDELVYFCRRAKMWNLTPLQLTAFKKIPAEARGFLASVDDKLAPFFFTSLNYIRDNRGLSKLLLQIEQEHMANNGLAGFINEVIRLGIIDEQGQQKNLGRFNINCSLGVVAFQGFIDDKMTKVKEWRDDIVADGFWESGKILIEVKYSKDGQMGGRQFVNQMRKYGEAVKDRIVLAVEYHITSLKEINPDVLRNLASTVPNVRVFWYKSMTEKDGVEINLARFGQWDMDEKTRRYHFRAYTKQIEEELNSAFGKGFTEIPDRQTQYNEILEIRNKLQDELMENCPKKLDSLAMRILEDMGSALDVKLPEQLTFGKKIKLSELKKNAKKVVELFKAFNLLSESNPEKAEEMLMQINESADLNVLPQISSQIKRLLKKIP